MKEFIQEKNLTNAKDATIHLTQKVIIEGMKGFVTKEKACRDHFKIPKYLKTILTKLEINNCNSIVQCTMYIVVKSFIFCR